MSFIRTYLKYHKHIQESYTSASMSLWSRKGSDFHTQDLLSLLGEVILAQLWSYKTTVLEYSTQSETKPGTRGWRVLWQFGDTIQQFQIWQTGEDT